MNEYFILSIIEMSTDIARYYRFNKKTRENEKSQYLSIDRITAVFNCLRLSEERMFGTNNSS